MDVVNLFQTGKPDGDEARVAKQLADEFIWNCEEPGRRTTYT